jgi:glutamine synthetase
MAKNKGIENLNRISEFLQKPPSLFTKSDIIKFIERNNIRMVNFRYVGGDGKLKLLNFVITGKKHLDQILSAGERVDGSSIFHYIDASSSDLYVIPRYKTAYVNPFSEIPAIDILCSYFTSEGKPLPSAPEYIVKKAHDSLKKRTGMTLEAMGELEYYVIYEKQPLYPTTAQKGYHGARPFCKWENMRHEVVQTLAQAGIKVKYSHSEVGNTLEGNQEMEQHEIECTPSPIEEMADQIIIAKWILRMIAHKYGVTLTFAPKVLVGYAGSGLHIHTKLTKNGKNVMIEGNKLSNTAKKAIAGYLTLAGSLTAFGNTVPISYLRLVPHQEAPTNICWGDRNHSVLVRVPLGWINVNNMSKEANPLEKGNHPDFSHNQTVEFRAPDGSADIYLLLAGLAVAAKHGLESSNSLEIAKKSYVDVNIFSEQNKAIQERLQKLPASCWESAERLLNDRKIYEQDNVFSPAVIDGVIKKLKSYNDNDLNDKLYGKKDEIKKLVDEYLHYA